MVGFTEALNITGASTTVKPILQDLVVCCSGDDGISVGGKAQPLIRSCDVRVSCRALCWSHQQQHGNSMPACLYAWHAVPPRSSGSEQQHQEAEVVRCRTSLSCRCATVA